MTRSPNKRIVHVTECLAGGTLKFLLLATCQLAQGELRQTLLYCRRPDSPPDVESLFDPRVELIRLETPRGLHFSYFRALRAALRRELADADVCAVHFHSSKAGFFGRLALLGIGRRVASFYSPHGLIFLDRRLVLPALLYRVLEGLAAKVNVELVGCSRSEARLLSRIGKRHAYLLENGVDDAFFQVRRRDTGQPLVVTTGRVCRQKAPECFAALAARFQIADVDARFVWIGGGDPRAEAQLRAAGVEVTGWVQREEVTRLLAGAAVYVQTSRWEGMPLSVLEALAAGVPCVVTDVVGNRDAVEHGQSGYVVNTLEEMVLAVDRLLNDAALRHRLSTAAREQARRRFSAASLRERLYRLYGLSAPSRTLPAPPELPGRQARPPMFVQPSPGSASASAWADRASADEVRV